MRDEDKIVRSRQLTIRRELDRRGLSLKAIAFDSHLSYSTLISYFPGERDREPATISGAALFALCGVLPADLISLILPDGFQIVRAPEAIDHDALCELANEYVTAKNRAHHPESEAGRDIGPGEEAALGGLVVQMVGSAAA
jgi:transcriptional regulator with XRE-family HTH domain